VPTHCPFVEHPQRSEHAAATALTAEEDVGGDVERRGDGQLLVDRLDPDVARIPWRAKVNAVPVEPDLALVRVEGAGERLDQRRLARSVVADDG
jgi:hypothetical protein